jgi:hypothetical protein
LGNAADRGMATLPFSFLLFAAQLEIFFAKKTPLRLLNLSID